MKTAKKLGVFIFLCLAIVASTCAQTWIHLIPSSEKPTHPLRIWTSAVYDPVSNRMTIFGGKPDGSCTYVPSVNDVWVLSNANGLGGIPAWTQLFPIGEPPHYRRGHKAQYDPTTNRMIVFGGDPTCACTKYNDVWVLTHANGLGGTPQWIQLSPIGPLPPGRTEFVAYYNAESNRFIIYGGFNCQGGTLNDVWVLENANGLGGTPAWTQLFLSSGPSDRGNHNGGYDPTTNRMFIYSGAHIPWIGLDDLWVLSNADGTGGPPVWTLLPQAGGYPGPRLEAANIYDPINNRFTIYGGQGTNEDVWVLENANGLGGTPTWILLDTSGTPTRRGGYAVYDSSSNRMSVFLCQEVWVLTDANGITITPQEAIEDLILLTEDMNLQQGIDNSLDAKLDAAFKALEDLNENNNVAAINALNAFINAVEAQRGKKIPDADADVLISAAQEIIEMLTGT